MFRFTIRDVLWLTVVVAVYCGWWIERQQVRRMKEEILGRLGSPGFISVRRFSGASRPPGIQKAPPDEN